MDEPGDAHISLGRVRMEDKASWMGCVDGEFQEKGFLGGVPWVSVPAPFQLLLLPDTPCGALTWPLQKFPISWPSHTLA